MFPPPSHLVLVRTHLDVSAAQASQEYILEGCPHPLHTLKCFQLLNFQMSLKSKWLSFFFSQKVGSGGKRCFKRVASKGKGWPATRRPLCCTLMTGRRTSPLSPAEQHEGDRVLWKESFCKRNALASSRVELCTLKVRRCQRFKGIGVVHVLTLIYIWHVSDTCCTNTQFLICHRLFQFVPLMQLRWITDVLDFHKTYVCNCASCTCSSVHPDDFCCVRLTLYLNLFLNVTKGTFYYYYY